MKPILTVMKRQLASNRLSILLTVLVMLLATTSADSPVALSRGNYAWLLAVLSPFFVVFYDFSKLIHLGATKGDTYWGSLASYGVLAASISLVNTAVHLLLDPLNRTQTVLNLLEVCGWWANGPFLAWLQQMVFLWLVMLFLHLLLSIQTQWYGWVADALLVAIVSIFTPIAPLRRALGSFFGLVMCNANAPLHLAVCLALSALLVFAGLGLLKRKPL